MVRNSIDFCSTGLHKKQVRIGLCFGVFEGRRSLAFGLLFFAMLAWTHSSQAVLLWGDLGATQVHETGAGTDILEGVLRRDDSSTNALYFKFHVDPLSDAATEEYFAAFQLFERNHERLAVGNALRAWAYTD